MGSPRDRTSSNCARISDVLIPRRRCVGWTPTLITAAVRICAPPGTVKRRLAAIGATDHPALIDGHEASIRLGDQPPDRQILRTNAAAEGQFDRAMAIFELVFGDRADLDVHGARAYRAASVVSPSPRTRRRAWPSRPRVPATRSRGSRAGTPRPRARRRSRWPASRCSRIAARLRSTTLEQSTLTPIVSSGTPRGWNGCVGSIGSLPVATSSSLKRSIIEFGIDEYNSRAKTVAPSDTAAMERLGRRPAHRDVIGMAGDAFGTERDDHVGALLAQDPGDPLDQLVERRRRPLRHRDSAGTRAGRVPARARPTIGGPRPRGPRRGSPVWRGKDLRSCRPRRS